MDRRIFLAALLMAPVHLAAQQADIWSAAQTHEAIGKGEIVLIDIRSREEWQETGVAEGAWPISLHEDRFAERLFAAREMAGGRPVAMICATGGRTDYVMQALRKGGYDGFIDVSEGMMGSALGRGWIAAGLPLQSGDAAITALPEGLR
jgi:rhodanese-related sulfurtransferase